MSLGRTLYSEFCAQDPTWSANWESLASKHQTQWENLAAAALKTVAGVMYESKDSPKGSATRLERKAKREARWEARTLKMIEQKRRIILKKRNDIWYLSQYTCIQAGQDGAEWACLEYAMMIEDLKWAFTLANLYGCEVWSINRYNERPHLEKR